MTTTMTSDPRPARTRRRLIDALYQLAESRDLTELSISEIARTAGVDRGSFYAQFADKQAFLDAICDELLAEFETMMAALRDPSWLDGEIDVGSIPSVYPIVARHPALYRQLLEGAGPSTFRQTLHRRMCAAFVEYSQWHGIATQRSLPPIEIRAEVATASVLALVVHWLEHGSPREIDQYTAWAWEVLALLGQRAPSFRTPAPGIAASGT